VSVIINGFLESSLRNQDGSLVSTFENHNTVMLSASSILSKNLSYKNKGGRSIMFGGDSGCYTLGDFTVLTPVLHYISSSNFSQVQYLANITDAKNENNNNEFLYTLSNGNLPGWIFLDPGLSSVVSALTINVHKFDVYTNGQTMAKLKTPCNWSIYGTNDLSNGSSGNFELIMSFIDEKWDYSNDSRWLTKTVIFPEPKTYKGYKIIFQTMNETGNAMQLKSIYLHENIMGLRRIKIGTNDLNGGMPDGTNNLVDLNNPVQDSNNGYAKGFNSGLIDMDADVTFEYPDTIKMRYKWINTLSTNVTVREVGAFDFNTGNPILVSRVIRDTVVKPMQYLDDVYKIKISVNN